MPFEDFFELVQNLDYYSKCMPMQIFQEGIEYPIGRMIRDNEKMVTLYFMHYHSFEEAKCKWLERGKRINYENLYIIFEAGDRLTQALYDSFKKIPFKNKVILAQAGIISAADIEDLDIYKTNNFDGKLFVI